MLLLTYYERLPRLIVEIVRGRSMGL